MLKQTPASRFLLGFLLIGVFAAIVVVACSRDPEPHDDSDLLSLAVDSSESPSDSTATAQEDRAEGFGSKTRDPVPAASTGTDASDAALTRPLEDRSPPGTDPDVSKDSPVPPEDRVSAKREAGAAPKHEEDGAMEKKSPPAKLADPTTTPQRPTPPAANNEPRPRAVVPEDSEPSDATRIDVRERFPEMFVRRRTGRRRVAVVTPLPPDELYEPKVVMSEEHRATCLVGVGDRMPDFSLPDAAGAPHELLRSPGENLSVILFWSSRNPYAAEQFKRLQREVLPFAATGVRCIAIHVGEASAEFPMLLEKHGDGSLCLTDSDQKFFGKVATRKLPRIYVLDKRGNILGFDIEYSRSARKALHNALRFFLKGPTEKPPKE